MLPSPEQAPLPGESARDSVAENLRRHRLRRALSMRELADRAGSSKGLLSQIERGVANPTLDVLSRLAEALDITVSDLIRPVLLRPEVVRAESAPARGEIAVRTLFTTMERRRTEFSQAHLAPDVRSANTAHGRGAVELAYVVDGSVQVESQGWQVDLGKGDALQFSAEHAHTYVAGPSGAVLLTQVGFVDD